MKYLTHLEFSRHTTISDVHELARDVLKACVKYSEQQVYIIGGYGTERLNTVYIYNPMDGFTHIDGPALKTNRAGHSCGVLSYGKQSKIVAAGGWDGNDRLSSVEILDPTVNKWIAGKEIHFLKRNHMKHKIFA